MICQLMCQAVCVDTCLWVEPLCSSDRAESHKPMNVGSDVGYVHGLKRTPAQMHLVNMCSIGPGPYAGCLLCALWAILQQLVT